LNYLKLDTGNDDWMSNWTRGSAIVVNSSPAKGTFGFNYNFSNKISYKNNYNTKEEIIEDVSDTPNRQTF